MRTALSLYDAGFTALVSVVPPNGIISSNSTLSQKDAGKAPGRRNYQGEYVGYNWMTHLPERYEVQQWLLDGSNVGFGAWAYPAIDIDITDPELAEAAIKAVESVLGPSVVRVGRAPKALLIYRCETPLKSFDVRYEGTRHEILGPERHLIQFLGTGRQYVVDGIHPVTGQPYTITDPVHAWQKGPSVLPLLTLDRLIAAFDAIAAAFEKLGLKPSINAAVRSLAGEVSQQSLKAPSIAKLEAVVGDIPNVTPNRDDYIAVGYAIRAASQDDPEAGRQIFHQWCSRWQGGTNDPVQVDTDWDKMAPPYRTGFDWLMDCGRRWGSNMSIWDFGEGEAPPAGGTTGGADTAGFEGTAGGVDPEADHIQAANFSEVALAEKFVKTWNRRLLTVPELGKDVYEWAGARWVRKPERELEHKIIGYLKKVNHQAGASGLSDTKRAEIGNRLGSRRCIQNVSHLVATSTRIAVTPEEVDNDPDILNTPAGPVDLRTGELLRAEPSRLLLRCAGIAPNPRATCPRWLQFMTEVTEGQTDLSVYLQTLAGYAATGHTKEQIFPFFLGTGGNGKSKFIRVLMRILGDYATTAPVELFQTRRSGGGGNEQVHEYHLARLLGARLIVTNETKTGGYWNEHRIKQITGEDRVVARVPHGVPFEFDAQATLIVLGNYSPELDHVSEAMARRLQIVPWNFRPTTPDKDLDAKLEKELPGIMNWILEGARMWYESGLQPPAGVTEETTYYLDEQDAIGLWIEDCVKYDRASTEVLATETVYESYRLWQAGRPGMPMGYPKFTQISAARLQQLGARRARMPAGRRGWKCITLLPTEILPANVTPFRGVAPKPTAGYHVGDE